MHEPWVWVWFNLFVLVMLAIDLGVFHRKAHEVSIREAAAWSGIWVALALTFGYGVYRFLGPQAGLEFATGYLIEKALSVDNLFVFILIFTYFRVPSKFQHRVLYWGILGALVMRGTMIGAGAILLHRFHWIIYVFGAFLVVTAIRMLTQGEEQIEPETNPALRLVRRVFPITTEYHGQRFFVRERAGASGFGRVVATPLFLVLVLVETTDLVFAVDSIPAIFAVTRDPFLVYSSNIFAILGLRALYFLLAGIMRRIHYLKIGLSIVLAFVGTKMLLIDVYKVPIGLSLGVIAAVLTVSVVASLVDRRAEEAPPGEARPEAVRPAAESTAEPSAAGLEEPLRAGEPSIGSTAAE